MLGNKVQLIAKFQLFDLSDDELLSELRTMVIDSVESSTVVESEQIDAFIGNDIADYFQEFNWSMDDTVDFIGLLVTEALETGEIAAPAWLLSDIDHKDMG